MRRALFLVMFLFAAAAAGAATRASASGRATVTIVKLTTASAVFPTHLGPGDDLRALRVSKREDPHSAAWLEMRPLGDDEGPGAVPRSVGAIDPGYPGTAAARLAITYHQF